MRRGDRKKLKGVRDYLATLVIGGKGQGKSTWLMDTADEYVKIYTKVYANSGIKPRVFIHDMSNSKAFADIMTLEEFAEKIKLKTKGRITVDHPLEVLSLKDKKGNPVWKSGMLRYTCRRTGEIEVMYRAICDHLTNAMVILDEWTTYIRANPTDWQIEIVNNHRNMGIELFLVCHQVLKVPPFFVRGDQIARIILFKTKEKNITEKQVYNKFSCAEELWPAIQKINRTKATNNITQPHIIIEV